MITYQLLVDPPLPRKEWCGERCIERSDTMIRTVFALAATVMLSGCVTNDRPRMTDAYIQWTCAHIPGETLSWCPGVMATMRQSAIANEPHAEDFIAAIA
jgi:hypothetical protein